MLKWFGYTYTHIHSFRFFSHINYHRILGRVHSTSLPTSLVAWTPLPLIPSSPPCCQRALGTQRLSIHTPWPAISGPPWVKLKSLHPANLPLFPEASSSTVKRNYSSWGHPGFSPSDSTQTVSSVWKAPTARVYIPKPSRPCRNVISSLVFILKSHGEFQ